MQAVYYLLALFIGLIVPLQALINNQMRQDIGGSPVWAALVSFIVGAVILLFIGIGSGQKITGMNPWDLPWWKLTGGLMGAIFVFGTIFVVKRIGPAAMLSLIILGQILTSLIFDKVGFMGIPVKELTMPRILGAVCIIGGVILVNFGDQIFKTK